MTQNLKILDLNTANYDDFRAGTDGGRGMNWDRRKQLIVDLIMEEDPEIVCLQEVRFDRDEATTHETYLDSGSEIFWEVQNRGKQCRQLFAPAQYYKPSLFEGLTTFVCDDRLQLLSMEVIYLPVGDRFDSNQREALFTRVEVKETGFIFGVVNLHATYSPELRPSHFRETLKSIEQTSGKPDFPVVIMGDFNGEIEKPEDVPSFEVFDEFHYIDLWSHLYPDDPGLTFRSWEPIKRIDYVYSSPSFLPRLTNLRILNRSESDISFNPSNHRWDPNHIPSDGKIHMSDHFGLVFEIDNLLPLETTLFEPAFFTPSNSTVLEHPEMYDNMNIHSSHILTIMTGISVMIILIVIYFMRLYKSNHRHVDENQGYDSEKELVLDDTEIFRNYISERSEIVLSFTGGDS